MAGAPCPEWRFAAASSQGEQRTSVTTSLAFLAVDAAGGAGSGFSMLLPILLFIPVFYLLLIRPQQKRQKQWQQMLEKIKAGDRVTTAGGVRGIILSIKDDAVIIRVAPDNLKLEVAKSAIASVTQEGPSGS
jgi:preprotein translocase subunit YajC